MAPSGSNTLCNLLLFSVGRPSDLFEPTEYGKGDGMSSEQTVPLAGFDEVKLQS